NLEGKGRQLDWKGVNWEAAEAKAELSSEQSRITYKAHTRNGSTAGTVTRGIWKESPFAFEGVVRDKSDRESSYSGVYQSRMLTLERFAGSADLVALSRDVHTLESSTPDDLKFESFPQVELRNLVRDSSKEPPVWSVERLDVISKDKVSFEIDGRPAEASRLEVSASHDGKDWTIRNAQADMLGGSISASGRYDSGVLRKAKVDFRKIRLHDLKQLSQEGGKRGSKGILSGSYRGEIDFTAKSLNGSGSIGLDNAPVLEVPLLDEVYDLFATLVPGVEQAKDGRFEANYRADGRVVDVTRFEATGGTLTVSAVGKVYLDKRTVSGRARGKLTGLPGLVTSPLSRLLEMDVGGPYDKIRVKPLGPAKLASNTASGTVGVVVDTIEETGKITGTVLTEGVKLPLRLLERERAKKKE
ncbi:MAG: hypothetical protein EOP85_08855, partial [Verrucomicrobiaceae bacterium]